MAASKFVIIDGYNLMHAAGMARLKYGPGDLERCRVRFLKHLAKHLAQAERERTTIVFDAQDAPPGVSSRLDWDGMEVLFARPGGDADALIEHLLGKHSAPRQVRVVSSDHRLQRAAQKRRAGFIDSETYLDELERRGEVQEGVSRAPPQEPPADPKYDGPLPAEEIEEWLDVFGGAADSLGAPDLLKPSDSPDLEDDEIRRWQEHLEELQDEIDDLDE